MTRLIKRLFAFGDFSRDRFEYCGITTATSRGITSDTAPLIVHQETCVEGRLEPAKPTTPQAPDTDLVERGISMDNLSGIGGLSWLAAQTRHDPAYGLSARQTASCDAQERMFAASASTNPSTSRSDPGTSQTCAPWSTWMRHA